MGKTRLETDILLALRPEASRPDGPTIAQRLRSLLKVALRQHGFRCISIAPDFAKELPPPEPGFDVEKDEPEF